MSTRIVEHPVLGKTEKGRKVTFTYNGKELEGYEGEPVAAALKAAGVMVHRYTKKQHSHLSFGLILFSHTNSEVPAKQGVQVVGMIFHTHLLLFPEFSFSD